MQLIHVNRWDGKEVLTVGKITFSLIRSFRSVCSSRGQALLHGLRPALDFLDEVCSTFGS